MRLLIAVLCSLGCSAEPPAAGGSSGTDVQLVAPKIEPTINGLPVTITLKQRTRTAIPGSGEQVVLSIGDITDGQVEVDLAVGNEALFPTRSMKVGEAREFDYGRKKHVLTLSQLHNALIGEDFAEFKVTTPAETRPLAESEKIDRLISAVESLEGAIFLRNGGEHSPKDAAEHLRSKKTSAGVQLKTARQFIDDVASGSSLSGKDYQIRLADGKVLTARDFLNAKLKELETPAAAAPWNGQPQPGP